jgi:hypothetical protein
MRKSVDLTNSDDKDNKLKPDMNREKKYVTDSSIDGERPTSPVSPKSEEFERFAEHPEASDF